MMGAGPRTRSWTARFAVLAALTLLVQLAVPPGFMVAASPTGPAVVICTGHGPMLATGDQTGLPRKSPAAPLCPFVGNCGPATLAVTPALAPAGLVQFHEVRTAHRSVDAGRGLAAPPPP